MCMHPHTHTRTRTHTQIHMLIKLFKNKYTSISFFINGKKSLGYSNIIGNSNNFIIMICDGKIFLVIVITCRIVVYVCIILPGDWDHYYYLSFDEQYERSSLEPVLTPSLTSYTWRNAFFKNALLVNNKAGVTEAGRFADHMLNCFTKPGSCV